MSDIDPESLFRRREAAKALSEAGFPVSPATLATKATRGSGPKYHLFGRVPLYRWRDLKLWADAKLSPPISSSPESYASK